MGLDYFVCRSCPAQDKLGRDGFLAKMQERRQGSAFRDGRVFLRGEDGVDREVQVLAPEGGMQIVTMGPGGTSTRRMTPDDVTALDRSLAPFERHCAGCPANVQGGAFGCYGYVSYPFTAETEQWLVDRAQAGGVDAAVATNALGQVGLTGQSAADLRARGDMFFASPEPLGVAWRTTDGSELVLTTDMVVELLLFGVPRMQGLVPVVCGLLGLFREGAGLREKAGSGAKELAASADVGRLAPTTPQEESLARYVAAMLSAFGNGLELRTDG